LSILSNVGHLPLAFVSPQKNVAKKTAAKREGFASPLPPGIPRLSALNQFSSIWRWEGCIHHEACGADMNDHA